MAIGVSFATGDMQVGIPLTTAIAIQDIPEALAVDMALRVASAFALGYPIAMGLASGAMIEVIPETHRNGHETPAALGRMLGFGVMMFLDTALG